MKLTPKMIDDLFNKKSIFDELTLEELLETQSLIGRIIMNLPSVSNGLGHTTILGTIRGNYMAIPDDGPRTRRIAFQYVNDLFTMRTNELYEKWGYNVTRPGGLYGSKR